ncbi:MAG: hypothetical protein WA510_32540 [Acidobacteriaceae bacterium]
MKASRLVLAVAAGVAVLAICGAAYFKTHDKGPAAKPVAAPSVVSAPSVQPVQSAKAAAAVAAPLTRIHAHNLSMRKGADFRVYVLWLSGHLVPTGKDVVPSLDEPDSFVIEIQNGVIHAKMADISHYMNTDAGPAMPLQNISISGNRGRISLHGTLHKLHVPVPIELEGTVSPSPDGRIRLHIDHLAVLKLPLKGVLSGFHLTIADLMGDKSVPGIEASGDDLFLDTQVLLPAPHIRGKLTSVHVVSPDIVVVYGDNAQDDAARTEQWHNFLSLKGGTLGFGKLTMRQVDLIMIDAFKDPWFDLDLVNYQAQLVYGYTRMTPQAGLQIFMPDVGKIPQPPKTVGAEWIKNRNLPPPPVGLPASQ